MIEFSKPMAEIPKRIDLTKLEFRNEAGAWEPVL